MDPLEPELHGGAVRVLFTTRQGGVSTGVHASLNLGRTDPARETDEPAAVATNRARVAARAGADVLPLVRQGHGARIGAPGEEADGMVARTPGAPVAVLAADCFPVAIAGDGAVAMVHAGWRGLAAGVLAAGAQALGAPPREAAIGPGIGPCCFEVGDEVRAAFADVPEARCGRNLDLRLVARRRLEALGVAHIHDAGLCTACDPQRFFSHRRDGALTGRQGGVAWLA